MAALNTNILGSQHIAGYTVRDADLLREGTEIIRLCRAGTLISTSEKYHWKYECPPPPPSCKLVIERASGKAVGTAALFPRKLLIDGTPFIAAVAGDFAVEAEHRTLFPALALQRAALEECNKGTFDVLYGFPNDAARLLQLRAGYRSAGHVVAGIRALRTRRLLEREGNLRWWGGIGEVLDLMVRFASKESRRPSGNHNYEVLLQADKRFDRFWSTALHHHRVVVDRNSSYFNWRFMQCPYRSYRLFAATGKKDSEIGGYILWSVSESGKVRISDMMALDEAFEDLLSAFIHMQQDKDAACITITYFGNQDLVRRLRQFGFFFRQTRAHVLLVLSARVPRPVRLFEPDNWYLLEGDSDS